MKITQLLSITLAVLLATVLRLPVARAQTPVTYTAGDLLLGFRAFSGTGALQSYEVNLGQASIYRDATGAFTVPNLGSIGADLVLVFGPDWFNRSDVFWSVSGTPGPTAAGGDPARTLYATTPELTPGVFSSPRLRANTNAQAAPTNALTSMAGGYTQQAGVPNNSTANSPVAIIQNPTDNNTYASYQTGSSSFAYFTGPTIEGDFTNGSSGTALDLNRLAPGTGDGTILGTFTIDNSGVLTFTPAGVAPVPGALAFNAATFTGPEVDAQSAPSVVPVTFNRTGGTSGAVTADLAVTGGSLTNGTDYVLANPTTVSFAEGTSTATVNIQLNAITASLPGTIVLGLSNPTGGATLGTTTSATVTINPVSANIHFTSATYTGSEAIAGGQIAVSITRDGNTSKAVTVNFSTASDTAIAGIDYAAQTNAPVSFAAGQTTQSVLVDVANVAGFQGSRAFNVRLSGPSAGAAVTTPSTGTVTITDDEVAPQPAVLALSAPKFNFNPRNAQAVPADLPITLTRTGNLAGAVAVDVSLSGGTLANGTDYTFTNPTTVHFADGATIATLNLPLNTIPTAKLPGTIILHLGNAAGGAGLGTQATANITVLKPDLVLPTVTAISPLPGGTVVPSFTLTGKALDAKGIDRVEVSLNKAPVQLATLGAFANGSLKYTLANIQPENGKNTLTITAVDSSGNKSLPLNLSVIYLNNRPAFAGSYNGLLVPAVTPANSLSGLVKLKVTATGNFTGNVALGGFTVPVSGVFGNDGTAHFKPKLATTLALVGPGVTPTALGTLALGIATDGTLGAKITGTLNSDPVTVAATLSAPRSFFNGLTPATSVDTRYTLLNKGHFTLVFPAKAQGALPMTAFPQGDGYANLTLTAAGAVSVTGKLADGTAFSAAATLAADYSWPFFAKLFGGKGSLAGLTTFDDSQALSDLSGANLLWFRPAKSASKYYPAGWPAGLQLDLLGAKYVKTTGTSVLPGLGALDPANGNATLVFSDGKLSGPLSKNLNIDPNNVVTNAPLTDKSFLLTIAKGTGQLAGSFKHSDLTKPLFSGILFQKGANAGGYGFFLSTVPLTPGATGESGGVSLSAK